MTYLVAVSILTGPPQSLSVDTTRLTDDSLITDWQTYFFAADTTITQYQSISVTAILAGQPIVSTTGLIQAQSFQANDLVTNQPVLSDTTLIENYPLQANNVVSLQPVVSVAPITEDENFLADDLISGIPQVDPASISQSSSLDAIGIISGVPQVDTTSISQNNSFDAIDILTGRPDVEDAPDPNVIYEQAVQQMFGGWPKRLYEHTELSVSRGHSTGYRTLYKFGYNPDVNGSEETVWAAGGNYLWLDNAVTMFVSSSSANDANSGTGANTILIQGLDEDYNEIEETIILNGQTQVTTQLSYLRVYRAYVTLAGSGGTSGGTIYVGSSGSTSGVPDGTVYASLALGNQTQIAAYTVPAGHTLYLDEINFTAALNTANKRVNASFHTRDFGSNVFRARFINVLQSSQLKQEFKYPQAFAEKTDMECRVYTDSTNNPIAASFQGVLIKNET
tara:strand:+ start:436 stop:1785 length:1350 start_codon:yes stop_codon:yes gene_type:complete